MDAPPELDNSPMQEDSPLQQELPQSGQSVLQSVMHEPPLEDSLMAELPKNEAVSRFVLVEFPQTLAGGLAEIAKHSPHRNISLQQQADSAVSLAPASAVLVSLVQDASQSGFSTSHADTPLANSVTIRFGRTIDAFRAVGTLLGTAFAAAQAQSPLLFQASAQPQFDTIGPMIDCSRSAVLSLASAKFLIRTCALLGLNTFQLYTEDTYAVDNEPFFGFMRGKYSFNELSQLDAYAALFGIEVFPCIQTLGHFGQILQWPAYAHLKDTSEVLLANNKETYDFLRRIIQAASAPFRSNRIHIGMDEANGMGEGRYKQLFGNKDSIQIYIDHLARVADICKDLGLQPLIWSDMLFTLTAQNSPYAYFDDTPLPSDLGRSFPSGVQLVYWNYYHTNQDIYLRKIQQHKDHGYEPWVASAVWTWNRLFAALPFTFDAAKACIAASKTSGVRNIVATLWGDDGNECDLLSALPGLAYFGEHAYSSSDDIDWSTFKQNFAGVCGGRLEDWIYASKLDAIPSASRRRDRFPPNPSKWILWQDPITSFLSRQYSDQNLPQHYTEISQYLSSASSDSVLQLYPLNSRLRFPALLAHVLSIKCTLRDDFINAYQSTPRSAAIERLESLLTSRLRPLISLLRDLHQYHRDHVWLDTFKPFGLEIIEMRYGAILIRLESMDNRITTFCQTIRNQLSTTISDAVNEKPESDDAVSMSCASPSTSTSLSTPLYPTTIHDTLPEFDTCVDEPPFPGFGMDLIFDFSRAYTPSRALGTG